MNEPSVSAALDRPWLAAYPPGVPHEIDPRTFSSLKHLLESSLARFAALPAFESFGSTLTFGEVDRLSAAFGAWLQAEARLRPGDRVALLLPNILQFPVAFIAAVRAGFAVVPVNPLSSEREIAFQLADSGAAAIVVLDRFAGIVRSAAPAEARCRTIVTHAPDLLPLTKRAWMRVASGLSHSGTPAAGRDTVLLRDVLADSRRLALRHVDVDASDIALLQYTGGTTGRPKAAMLTHGNLVANVEQTRAWVSPPLGEGCETVVTALPLCHAFALVANLLLFIRIGGRNVLVPDARRLPALVRLLARTRFSAMTGVETLYRELLDARGFHAVAEANAGVLKVAIAGGMTLERRTAERWRQKMGVRLVEGYGLTEASPNVSVNRLDTDGVHGCLGLPLPSTEVAILDERGGRLPPGVEGEIAVRGPQVMRGYWNAPQETEQVLPPDGWLRTGDIGRIDERGYLHFVDRRKDIIVVSGFKAYPREIEAVVREHPGVKDAAAVAIPDARRGQAVALIVVRRDPALTANDLRTHCAQRLSPYKRPRLIEFRDRLPLTPLGKTLRRELRVELETHTEP